MHAAHVEIVREAARTGTDHTVGIDMQRVDVDLTSTRTHNNKRRSSQVSAAGSSKLRSRSAQKLYLWYK